MTKYNIKIIFGNIKDTPYYDEIKNIKENYSEKDKNQDNKFMNQMIERA